MLYYQLVHVVLTRNKWMSNIMNVPEYMRVRSHIYNLVIRSDGSNMMIPSENELSSLFAVSRVTVRGAIKGLVKDKFLIPRRGIGTFINPEKIGRGIMRIPMIALISGDGRQITNLFYPAISNSIIQSGMKCENVFLPDSDSPERLREIIKAGFDAVIWVSPGNVLKTYKYLEALHTNEIPLLTVDIEDMEQRDGIDSIVSDTEARGRNMAEYLFSRNHQNLLFIHNRSESCLKLILEKGKTHFAFCARLKELAGDKSPVIKVISLLDLEEKLQKTPDYIKRFSVLYSLATIVPYVMNQMNQANIKIPEDISYLVFGKSNPYFFNGLRPAYVDNETVLYNAVLKWCDLRLRRKSQAGTFRRCLNMKIFSGETLSKHNAGKKSISRKLELSEALV